MLEKFKFYKLYKLNMYLITFLLIIKCTILYSERSIIFNLVPFLVLFEFILILINYKLFISKSYIKNHIFIISYFILRLCSFIVKFDLSNLKTLFYELFFLIGVFCVFEECKKEKKQFLNFIFCTISILQLISIVVSIISLYFKIPFKTIYFTNSHFEYQGLYTNPNVVGVYSFLAIILAFILYYKQLRSKIYFYLFTTINVCLIYFSNGRTSLLAVLVYFLLLVFTKFININYKKFAYFIEISIASVFLILFSMFYINENNIHLTNYEEKLNESITNRYVLWKYSVLSLNEKSFFGIENNKIAETRIKTMPTEMLNELGTSRYKSVSTNNNTHNSFIQILVTVGIFNFIIFLIFIFSKIEYLKNYYFISSISIIVLSFFENELLMSKSVVMIIFALIISINKETDIGKSSVIEINN